MKKLKKQLDKIWSTAQAMEIGELLSLYGYSITEPAVSFTEELSRIIVNNWSEDLLNGPLSYLYNQRSSILGAFSETFLGQNLETRRVNSLYKDLGNSERSIIWRSLDFSGGESDFFTLDENGKICFTDESAKLVHQYVLSAINKNVHLQKEIDKYVEMCNNALLTYFDSYVDELRTKL